MSGEPTSAPIPEFPNPSGPSVPRKPQFPILKFFKYTHLPNHLKDISKPFCDLAEKVSEMAIPEGENAEIAAGLRKLLEAKDCIVRAMLNKIP